MTTPAPSLQSLFDALSPLERSQIFCGPADHSVVCVDDRIITGSVHLPGAGILLRDPVAAACILKNLGVTEVNSHENCGATSIVHADITKELSATATLAPPAWFVMSSAEDTAKQFVSAVVDSLKTFGVSAARRHLTFDNGGMMGDRTIHRAAAVYYDLAGHGFNQFNVPGKLPLGFTVTAIPNEEATNLASIIAVVTVAFGKTGQPEIYADTPLKIALLTTDERAAKDISPKISHVLAAKFPDHSKHIVIETVLLKF